MLTLGTLSNRFLFFVLFLSTLVSFDVQAAGKDVDLKDLVRRAECVGYLQGKPPTSAPVVEDVFARPDAALSVDARALGELIDWNLIRDSLEVLTGEKSHPSIEGAILTGRFTEEQKQLARTFIMDRVRSYGVDVLEWRHVYARRKVKSSFLTDDIEPLNLDTLSKSALMGLYDNYTIRDGLKFLYSLAKVKAMKANPGLPFLSKDAFLRQLTSQTVGEALREIFAISSMEKLSLFVEDVVNVGFPDEFILPGYVEIDLRKIHKRLKAAEAIRANPEKAKKPSSEPEYIEEVLHNLVIEIPGTERPNEVIEYSAHLDTTGEDKPGADDNGSAVALGIELARLFSIHRPKVTVRILIADLEEFGHEGQIAHLTDFLPEHRPNQTLLGSVVVDTIAWSNPNLDRGAFVIEMGTKGMHDERQGYNSSLQMTEAMVHQYLGYKFRNQNLQVLTWGAMPGTADHGPYWDLGIPSVLIAAPFERDFINPQYHKKGDTISGINWKYYHSLGRFTTESMAVLAGVTLNPQFVPEELKLRIAADWEEPTPAMRVDVKSKEPESKPKKKTSAQSGGSGIGEIKP